MTEMETTIEITTSTRAPQTATDSTASTRATQTTTDSTASTRATKTTTDSTASTRATQTTTDSTASTRATQTTTDTTATSDPRDPGTAPIFTAYWIPAHMAEKYELTAPTTTVTSATSFTYYTFTTALKDIPAASCTRITEETLYLGARADDVLADTVTDRDAVAWLLADMGASAEEIAALPDDPRLIRIRWQADNAQYGQFGLGSAVMDTAGMLNVFVPVCCDPDAEYDDTPCIYELYLLVSDSALPNLRSVNLRVGLCRTQEIYDTCVQETAYIRLRSTHY